MYKVKDFLQLFKPGDKIYITHPAGEYDRNLLLYKHPRGKFSMNKCETAFNKRLKYIYEHLGKDYTYTLLYDCPSTNVLRYLSR